MSDEAGSGEPRKVAASRVVAIGLCAIGAVAVFLWANHAIQAGKLWQVGVASLVWVLHAVVVMRLWRGR